MDEVLFILYVGNQDHSKDFYEGLLDQPPCLHVSGMTEFDLTSNTKLGLMPEEGIVKILGGKMPHPVLGTGIPRCEVYLKVNGVPEYIKRGIGLGAKLLSPLSVRNWGDSVAYISDIDVHIIALCENN